MQCTDVNLVTAPSAQGQCLIECLPLVPGQEMKRDEGEKKGEEKMAEELG